MVLSMNTKYSIQTRAFPVQIKDMRTGEQKADMIVLDKQQLQVAETMGLTPDDLIYHRYNEQGYKVLEISKAIKRTITLDLKELYKAHCIHEVGKWEKVGV